MRKVEGLKQLSDAADLLNMLEQLVDSLARRDGVSDITPWRGIRLTLGQARTWVTRASEVLSQDLALEQSFMNEPMATKPQRIASSPLAGRIQKAPISGRVREIVEPSPQMKSKTNYLDQQPEVEEIPAAIGES
jgi:hypothetical protein